MRRVFPARFMGFRKLIWNFFEFESNGGAHFFLGTCGVMFQSQIPVLYIYNILYSKK